MPGRVVRYSEAFKCKVVREVEEGRFCSPHQASQVYGIGGKGTVALWIKKYGKTHLLKQVIRVETEDEIGELKRLKDRVKALETALADSVMDNALNESFFEILCDRMDVDAAEFKKKHGGTALTKHARKRKDSKE